MSDLMYMLRRCLWEFLKSKDWSKPFLLESAEPGGPRVGNLPQLPASRPWIHAPHSQSHSPRPPARCLIWQLFYLGAGQGQALTTHPPCTLCWFTPGTQALCSWICGYEPFMGQQSLWYQDELAREVLEFHKLWCSLRVCAAVIM